MGFSEVERHIARVIEVGQRGRGVIGRRFKYLPSPFYDEVFLVLGDGGEGECIPDQGIGEPSTHFKPYPYKVLPWRKRGSLYNGESKTIRVGRDVESIAGNHILVQEGNSEVVYLLRKLGRYGEVVAIGLFLAHR